MFGVGLAVPIGTGLWTGARTGAGNGTYVGTETGTENVTAKGASVVTADGTPPQPDGTPPQPDSPPHVSRAGGFGFGLGFGLDDFGLGAGLGLPDLAFLDLDPLPPLPQDPPDVPPPLPQDPPEAPPDDIPSMVLLVPFVIGGFPHTSPSAPVKFLANPLKERTSKVKVDLILYCLSGLSILYEICYEIL